MHSNVLLSFGLVFGVFGFGVFAKRLPLPSYMKQCHRTDPNFEKCSIQHAKEAIPTIVKGDRKYNIPVLAPLVLPSVEMNADEQLKLTLIDLHIYNLDRVDVKNVKLETEKNKVTVRLFFDKLDILGKYDVNGRILILPIQGNGDLNVTAVEMEVTYEFEYNLVAKNGDEYMSPRSSKADFTLKRAYFHLGNLFNGNDELGESTNKVLNEEWEKFLEEIKPSISKLIVGVADGIINGITSKVPYNEFFPE